MTTAQITSTIETVAKGVDAPSPGMVEVSWSYIKEHVLTRDLIISRDKIRSDTSQLLDRNYNLVAELIGKIGGPKRCFVQG